MLTPKIKWGFISRLVPDARRHFKVGIDPVTNNWTVTGGNPGGKHKDSTMFEAVDRESFNDLRTTVAYLTRAKEDMKEFIKSCGTWEAYQHHIELKYETLRESEPSYMVKRGLNWGTTFMSLPDILVVTRNLPESSINTFTRKFIIETWEHDSEGEREHQVYFMNFKGRINDVLNGYDANTNKAWHYDSLVAEDWCFVDSYLDNKGQKNFRPISISEMLYINRNRIKSLLQGR